MKIIRSVSSSQCFYLDSLFPLFRKVEIFSPPKGHLLQVEGNFLNVIRGYLQKPTAYITVNGKRLKVFFLRSGKTQGDLLLQLLFNIVLGVLASEIRQEKEERGIQLEKRNKTTSICI